MISRKQLQSMFSRPWPRAMLLGAYVIVVGVVAWTFSPAAAYVAALALVAPFVGNRVRVGLLLALAVPLLTMGVWRSQDTSGPTPGTEAVTQSE